MLDRDLSRKLEDQWERHGVSWLPQRTGAPGGAAVQNAIAAIGLRPPAEVVQLWSWFALDTELGAAITPLHTLLTLDGGIYRYNMHREVADDLAAADDEESADPDVYWPVTYVPVLQAAGPDDIAVDSTLEGEDSPLFFVDVYGDVDRSLARAPSIAALLSRVCELYEANAYVWVDQPAGRWVYQGPGEDPLTAPNLS